MGAGTGMLRIHFSTEDLARIRVATGPDPMWEILLSLHALGTPRMRAVFRWWSTSLRTAGYVPAPMLRALAPPTGYSADFLTPAGGVTDVADGIAAVLRTPRSRLLPDLEALAAARRLPAGMARLAAGDPELLRRLGDAMAAHYRVALAPFWRDIRAGVDVDRAARGETLLNRGGEGLLATLHPTIRWNPPVLEAAYPQERDLHLDGRGLRLQPAVFCWRMPITVLDPAQPPVLVYPVAPELRMFVPDRREAATGPLTALLGRTRAAALEVIGAGTTTGELARRLGVSPSTASQHATVLRDTGLIVSYRDRNTVRHSLTELGRRLLDPSSSPPR
jgi:DNA-binding transcriptional ArsR family regulator